MRLAALGLRVHQGMSERIMGGEFECRREGGRRHERRRFEQRLVSRGAWRHGRSNLRARQHVRLRSDRRGNSRVERAAADRDGQEASGWNRRLPARAPRRWDSTPIERGEIDRNPLGDQAAEDAQEGITAFSPGTQAAHATWGRLPRMSANQAGARSSRSDFDEDADAVLVGTLDHGGIIDRIERLRDDRFGGRRAVGEVRAAPAGAIDANAGGRSGRRACEGRGRRLRPRGRSRNAPC